MRLDTANLDTIEAQNPAALQKGAAGAAAGVAGGYRLPLTAVAMVIGVGGPYTATITCLATVGVAAGSGLGVAWGLERLTARRSVASPEAQPATE